MYDVVKDAERAPLWLADWSDGEHEDFRAAWLAAGVEARVLRATPLGATVGTRRHQLRSWPAYLQLAVGGLLRAGDGPLVAWQPLAGALAGLLRRREGPRLVLLNPLLDANRATLRRRTVLAGSTRADRVLFYSRRGLDTAVALGLPRERARFVPLGVRARIDTPEAAGDYVIVGGREGRDWETLARAARGLDLRVVAFGPLSSEGLAPLEVHPRVSRERFLELVAGAAALVMPLHRPDITAGQLAVLEAMALGRAVVATRAQGTEDYVTPDTGLLVPPKDSDALRDALRAVCETGVAARMGAAGLKAVQGPLSLERFVARVDEEARGG